MSFNTKFSMWWGSVTTKTEKLFNKEKQRLVTHEYYDNPNPKSARPKSMHSIRGSMRAASSSRGSRGGDAEPRSKPPRQEQEQRGEDSASENGDVYQQQQNAQNPNDGQYAQDQQYAQQQQYQGYQNQGYNQGY